MSAPSSIREAVVEAGPWLQKLARVGYVAKGVIYSLIGIFALMAAVGIGGKKTNQAGAINSVGQLPLGQILLLLIGAGLIGYSLWRLAEATFDPERKGVIKRIGYVISALAYGGFGWAALRVAISHDHAQSNPQQGAARLLSVPFGQALGTAVAIIFVIGAGLQIWNGIIGKFTETLKREEMSGDQMALARWTGGIGLIARGCLFGLIGWFMWRASRDGKPGEAGGIDRALTTIAQAHYGPTLLAIMAVGLICYGVYMWVQARFRRMVPVAASPS